MGMFSKERVIVGIEGYLVDITDFIDSHPGSKQKIINKQKELGLDITRNFIDHFGHTVRHFRDQCKKFEAGKGEPLTFEFKETPGKPVIIVGRMEKGQKEL